MALFEWSDSLSVGVATIDGQHKELVKLLNDLHAAAASGQADTVLAKTFDGLLAYTRSHFSNEERMMQGAGYPEFVRHKAEHDKLTATALELQQKYKAGNSTMVTIDAMKFLKQWLITHIQQTDKRAGAFIAARKAA